MKIISTILWTIALAALFGFAAAVQLFLNLKNSNREVYPLELKINEMRFIDDGKVLTNTFRLPYSELTSIDLVLGREATSSSVLEIRGGVEGKQGFLVEISGSQVEQSPLLSLQLPFAMGSKGELFVLEMREKVTSNSPIGVAVWENSQLKLPQFASELKINGALDNKQLLFRPKFKNMETVNAYDDIQWRYEWSRLTNRVIANRPVWLVGTLLVTMMTLLIGMARLLVELQPLARETIKKTWIFWALLLAWILVG